MAGIGVKLFSLLEGVTIALDSLRANKVRAVWQGYASGLAGLATDHGVNVDDDQPATAPIPAAPLVVSPPSTGDASREFLESGWRRSERSPAGR